MSGKKLADGDEVAIVCPDCSPPPKLIVRTNKKTKRQFLGCPNWPDCNHTEEMPVSLVLREQGQKGLFDAWLDRKIE